MCLAVPMTVVEVHPDGGGVVELEGVRRSVRLDLLDGPAVGDIVIVHAGYAIETLDPAEAEARLELFERMAAIYEEEGGESVYLVAPPAPPSTPRTEAGRAALRADRSLDFADPASSPPPPFAAWRRERQ